MPARAASILTTVVLVLLLGAANAQDAADKTKAAPAQERTLGYYRCGPQGQELRDSPCPDGQGRAAEAPKDEVDPRAAAPAAAPATGSDGRLQEQKAAKRPGTQKKTKTAAGADKKKGQIGQIGQIGQNSQKAQRPSKPADPKKPKPKDPKAPKKKPKVPKSPEPSLPPTPSTAADR